MLSLRATDCQSLVNIGLPALVRQQDLLLQDVPVLDYLDTLSSGDFEWNESAD